MIYSIQCVHCQAVLKSSMPMPAGKKTTCPKCGQKFRIPGATALAEPSEDSAAPAVAEDLFAEDDEMAAAIAKLEAEQMGSKKPSSAEPAPTPSAAEPQSLSTRDDDELAAAIAKLEAEQSAGKKPAAPAPPAKSRPAPPPVPHAAVKTKVVAVAEVPEIDDDDLVVEDDPPEKPRKRLTRGSEKDADAFTEKPAVKNKSRRREEETDEKRPPTQRNKRRDEEDSIDEPRPGKSKKKKAGSPVLLFGLIGGAVFGLLVCCIAGGIGIYLFGMTDKSVLGKWESEIDATKVEFSANGNVKFVDILSTAEFDYKVVSGDPMILEFRNARIKGNNGNNFNFKSNQVTRFNMKFEGDTLTLTNADPLIFGRPIILRRVR